MKLAWWFFPKTGRHYAYADAHTFRIAPYGLLSCCTIFVDRDATCREPIAVVGQLIVPSIGEAMRRAQEWHDHPFDLPTFLPPLDGGDARASVDMIQRVERAVAECDSAGPRAAQGGL
jgi:hypothetical protein